MSPVSRTPAAITAIQPKDALRVYKAYVSLRSYLCWTKTAFCNTFAENVAVPEQLRNARGIQALTAELKQQFATSRGKELHCIKLACHWSHPRSSYSDLLGSLTTLGDVEALSYQWQGHADKTHSADRMLKRICLVTMR